MKTVSPAPCNLEGAKAMRRAVIYLRVSTLDQTTANQERELREIAGRMSCEIVKVYRDHGISGTRGRDKRPAFDKLCRDAARREFDVVMAWSVDRLGRSLQDLVAFLSGYRCQWQGREGFRAQPVQGADRPLRPYVGSLRAAMDTNCSG
jgi:predicted site-specific integrase-resolvase